MGKLCLFYLQVKSEVIVVAVAGTMTKVYQFPCKEYRFETNLSLDKFSRTYG